METNKLELELELELAIRENNRPCGMLKLTNTYAR